MGTTTTGHVVTIRTGGGSNQSRVELSLLGGNVSRKRVERKMSLVSIPAQQHPFGIDGQPMRFASPGITQIRPVWKALKRLFAATGTPADREYERLLESSGGKFTDSLERTAERHMNGLH